MLKKCVKIFYGEIFGHYNKQGKSKIYAARNMAPIERFFLHLNENDAFSHKDLWSGTFPTAI